MTQPAHPPDGSEPSKEAGGGAGGAADEASVDELSYPRLAPAMVAVTVLLFVSMVALLCFRWLSMAEPNGFVEVRGTPEFAGIRVEVSGESMASPAVARLSSANNYTAHFPLPRGAYRVSILQDEQLLARRDVNLREAAGVVYPLDPQVLPATQPSRTPVFPLPDALPQF